MSQPPFLRKGGQTIGQLMKRPGSTIKAPAYLKGGSAGRTVTGKPLGYHPQDRKKPWTTKKGLGHRCGSACICRTTASSIA